MASLYWLYRWWGGASSRQYLHIYTCYYLLSTLGLGGAHVVSVITSDMGTATPILLLTGNTSMIAASCQSGEYSMPESTLSNPVYNVFVFVNIQWPSGVMAWGLESLAVLSDFITTLGHF